MHRVRTAPGSEEKAKQRKLKPAQAIVRCEGFRCAAYMDEKGVWRSVADDTKLNVLEVLVRF
jgi:hypothetical protein